MLLELKNIVKRYASPTGAQSPPVLDGISLGVEAGESLVILGPSGSGKSTLLNIMGALDRPSSGSVLLAGRDLSSLRDQELASIRNREIGFIFQLHHLLPQCTVLENVLVPTLAGKEKRDGEADRERALRFLERVGLTHRIHHSPGQLSVGERQRASVVRALINGPKLVLADEPTGSLDAASSENLGRLLKELNREEGVTLILATHSEDLAGNFAKAVLLREGRLEAFAIPGGRGP